MSYDCAFLVELNLGEDQVSTGDSHRREHAGDFGTREEDEVSPDAVVWPESTEDVSRVLKAANERGVPVTAFGAGTALSSHVVPVKGGVSLDTKRLDSVLEVRPADLQIDVEPGVYGSAVDEALEEHGLFFPPLPTSGDISTIGGMLSTDASGMQTVKYGEVREWVLGLEVVLADGSVLRTGGRAAKTSSGYNLKELMVGSEGTLGIITRATLKLAGRPEQIRGGRARFSSLDDAAGAISESVRYDLDVARIELLDAPTARMASEYSGLDLPQEPLVFFEFHANHGVEEEIDFARSIFEAHDVRSFKVSDTQEGMVDLWQARHDLAYAIQEYPGLDHHGFGDVTVPISGLSEMIRDIGDVAEEYDLLIPCFGHAGDGNVHYSIMFDPDEPGVRDRVGRADADIVRRALAMGGTSTGEHGIGTQKIKYMEEEHGPEGVSAMRAIKQALDPNNILNPGKIFP